MFSADLLGLFLPSVSRFVSCLIDLWERQGWDGFDQWQTPAGEERGRSRKKLRTFLPLLALWVGIKVLVAAHPHGESFLQGASSLLAPGLLWLW